MSLTTDPSDPELGHGPNETPVPQNTKYLVLSEEDRAKGFVRPLRRAYRHEADVQPSIGPAQKCGSVTTMALALCETYARQPSFYGATYCTGCQMHRPVSEFIWVEDGEVVGS